MKDDVFALLSSKSPRLTPAPTFSLEPFQLPPNGGILDKNSDEIALKIKLLEEQARQFKCDQSYQSFIAFKPIEKYKAIVIDGSETQNAVLKPQIQSNDLDMKQIKERVELQLRETEQLKKELANPTDCINNYTSLIVPNKITTTTNMNMNMNNLIEEVVELRVKLKEAYATNEELKVSFTKNLSQLENTLRDCMEEKEKFMFKKDSRVKELENEIERLNSCLSQHQKVFGEDVSIEDINRKVQMYDDLFSKLRLLIINEETKREKSYFTDGSNLEPNQLLKDQKTSQIYKAFLKCLEDYQSEIKHSKIIIKELQNSWETKEKDLYNKETNLNQEFTKKCATIKEEYDRILNVKQNELNNMQAQMDNLSSKHRDDLEKLRRKFDSKDVELKQLQANYDSIRSEKDSTLKELKQIKIRFENLKAKEKENQINYDKTLNELEKENEILNNKNADLSASMDQTTRKFESIKCQLTKYEQLIDSLNEKVILLKRECKESQLNLKQTVENLNTEVDVRTKLENKCQQLEQQLDSKEQSLVKYEHYEKNLSVIQTKYKQMQTNLATKSSELIKLKKVAEENELKLDEQAQQLNRLNEIKVKLEDELKLAHKELNELRTKFENSTVFIQHSCKANSLLKDEKESLDRILKDNAVKLETLKKNYDELSEKYSTVNNQFNELIEENHLTNVKIQEIKNYNEIILKEKEDNLKALNQTRNELNNLQINYKTLNKKLGQTISEKENQICQFQQQILLLEKEVNLLKQVETLHKTHEDNKLMEVAQSAQLKLAQKKTKIETLKMKLNSYEQQIEALSKEKTQLSEEKFQLEVQLNNSLARNDSLRQQINQIEVDFNELKSKLLQYEKALDNAAIKYTNSVKKYQLLENDMLKFKKLINAILISNDNEISVSLKQQINTSELAALSESKSTSDLVVTQLKQNKLNSDLIQNMNKLLEMSDIEHSTTVLNESHVSCQEFNQQLCNRIETKLNQLNQIGLNLKKENNEVTQLLQNGLN